MGLTYADAAKLMGAHGNRTVAALDRLTGGLLLAASAASGGLVLSLFEAKSELARLSDELAREIGDRLHGLDKYTRSERLSAAHSVIALAAFFEVLAEAKLPLRAKELQLTKAEQVSLAGGGDPGPGRLLGGLASALLRTEVPMPTPQRPSEASLEAMRYFYLDLAAGVSRFASGRAAWQRLDAAQQRRFAAIMSDELPGRAVLRYEERFRKLAVQFPEIAFWMNSLDHQATREEVRRVSRGMQDLKGMLAAIDAGHNPDDRRLALSTAYQAALQRPVLISGHTHQGLRLPRLGESYIVPDFRAVKVSGDAARRLSDESWWEDQAVRDDLEAFLFGYLLSPQAVRTPLLVLGQPGSGKSVLTQMLAAQLPADQFLVVRVALPDVAVDADLQAQIEEAIRSATGETVAWPDLVRSADQALPLVLLDGFDELLQATGVSHTDYLDRVADFQIREAAVGRPVAIVVTSRTAVADRATPPPETVVVRLEPFRDSHIAKWLEVWNRANRKNFDDAGVQPLTLDTVLQHQDMASQPLLLIMLALYYADGNSLPSASASRTQTAAAVLNEADLYEHLLVGFAEREIRKADGGLPEKEFRDAVERELLRLSVVAFAMFSRSRQWVSEIELDSDLPALLGTPGGQVAPHGLRAPLTAAQVEVGRFFFIHEAQATRDNTRLHAYEFLHATFGEYLIARLLTRELADLADTAQLSASRTRQQSADDTFLHALLSYMPLTMHGTTVSFIDARLRTLPDSRRQELHAVLLDLFGDALGPRHDTRYNDYAPLPISMPARCAAYSANLAVLVVLSTGAVTGSVLFPAARDPVTEWRNLAMLWRSQLPLDGWGGLLQVIAVTRAWTNDGRRDIVLTYDNETGQRSDRGDLYWTYNRATSDEYRVAGRPFGWSRSYDSRLRSQAWFLCDQDEDTLIYALEPFKDGFDGIISSFHSYWPDEDRAVSTVNALIRLWRTSSSDCSPAQLAEAFNDCIEIAIRARFGSDSNKIRVGFRTLVLRQLVADQQRVPQGWLKSVIQRIRESAGKEDAEVRAAEELTRIADAVLFELMSNRSP